ncbi:hypothetical protein Tco_1418109 [Tanacetum coccineum]
MLENQEYNKSKSNKGYHVVPPPYTRNFIPFKPDLIFMDEIVESENMDVTTIVTPSNVKTVESKHESANVKNKDVEPKTVRKNSFIPLIIEDWNSDDESEVDYIPNVEDKTVRPSTEKLKFVKHKTNCESPNQLTNAYKKGYSQVTRPFNINKNNNFNKNVNTVRVKDTTARDRAVVSENKGKGANAVRPQTMLGLETKNIGNPQQKEYKKKELYDSGMLKSHELKQMLSLLNMKIIMVVLFPLEMVKVEILNKAQGYESNLTRGQAEKKIEPEQDYILIPICTTDPLISQDPKVNKEDA